MNKKAVTFSLKDQLFNKQKVEYLSGLIKNVHNEFDEEKFIEDVVIKFSELELKQRIVHISDMLRKYLLDDFQVSVNIMIKSLPELEDNGTLDNNFGDFIFSPYCFFIQKYGCTKEYLEFSLQAQGKITAHASAEDSIRYFYNAFEEETFSQMLQWSRSDNYFLRRLSSEGSRAKLPWCQNINLDYRKTIVILDNLYYDESRFVTRSVANHLNDISKIDGNLVVKVLEGWKKAKKGSDLDYIISHGTRTLVKKGHHKTLEFLGYSTEPKIEFKNFKIKNKQVKIGESLEFNFNIRGEKSENLIIDYKIYFIAKNGKLLPKVFKLKKLLLKNQEKISKKHPLRMMTTKALYEGEHFVEIVINGKSFGKKSFQLQEN